MQYIKNVGYGIVARSVKLQVFLTPQKYLEVVNEAKSYKVNAKTDSELINRVLEIFLTRLPIIRLENDRIKAALIEKNCIIAGLQTELNDFKLKKGKK